MAILRQDSTYQEVVSSISKDELHRLVSRLSDLADSIPLVPVYLRATGEAARAADEMCLAQLEENARIRRVSWY